MRTVFVDSSTTPVTFWTGSNTEPHWLKWNPWTNWFQETFRPLAASPRCGGGRAFLRGGGSGPRPLLVHATVRHEGAGELCTIKHHAG
jgi:hypothetical protein